MTVQIDKVEWAILDSLSDDYESLEQIVPVVQEVEPSASREGITQKLQRLIECNLISPMDESADWFGMTSKGCEHWEQFSQMFSQSPVDWSEAWTANLNYKTGIGHIDGVSRDVCESVLRKDRSDEVIVDFSSVRHMPLDSFDAKYYKRIKGGHRIEFEFKLRTEGPTSG